MCFKSARLRVGVMAVSILGCAVLHSNTQAGQFKFPVGVAFSTGAQNVIDGLKDNYNVTDDFVWPVGVTLNPYYELDMGLAFGVSVGPSCFVVVDRTTYYPGYSTSETKFSYIVPVGGFVRYTLFRDSNVSPYIRGGITYDIAGGDYIGTGDAGGFGAVGVELWRNKRVGLGVEVGYSTSTVTIKAGPRGGERSADYGEVTVSVMAVF